MTTSELFQKISTTPEFKADTQARVIKHRHNNGVLTSDTYIKLFAKFGYVRLDKWVKKK